MRVVGGVVENGYAGQVAPPGVLPDGKWWLRCDGAIPYENAGYTEDAGGRIAVTHEFDVFPDWALELRVLDSRSNRIAFHGKRTVFSLRVRVASSTFSGCSPGKTGRSQPEGLPLSPETASRGRRHVAGSA